MECLLCSSLQWAGSCAVQWCILEPTLVKALLHLWFILCRNPQFPHQLLTCNPLNHQKYPSKVTTTKKPQMVIVTIFIFQNEERKVKRGKGCLRRCFEEQGWKPRSPDFLYQKSLLTTLPSLWICMLVCAEDQIRINLYPQGTIITELITKGHICTSQHVNWCYLFGWRFPPCFFGQPLL